MTDTTYNGWANYETWNVALYMDNDYSLYQEARRIARRGSNYQDLVNVLYECGSTETPDGVSWTDTRLDGLELNEALAELA